MVRDWGRGTFSPRRPRRGAEENQRKALAAAEAEKKAKESAEAREAETAAVLGFVQERVFAAARPEGQEGGLGRDVLPLAEGGKDPGEGNGQQDGGVQLVERERVPDALQDPEGPWKLLAWLDQIQPTLTIGSLLIPSYTLKVLLDELEDQRTTKDRLKTALAQVASNALIAEQNHLLRSINALLDSTLDRLEEKVKLLVALIGRMRTEQARLADDHQKVSKELETARARLQEVEGATAEAAALKDERDLIRARVGSLLEQIEGLSL